MQPAIKRAVALLCMGGSSFVDASGFRSSIQSAEYSGQGDISVNEGSAASIHYNPSGIAGLETSELLVGMSFADQEISGRQSSGSVVQTDSNWSKAGNIFYAKNYGGHYFGLGVYSPFGSTAGRSTGRRLEANESETKVSNPTLSLAYAIRLLDDKLSLGAAVNYSQFNLEYRQGLGIIPGGELSYKAEDTDIGVTLGAQFHTGRHHFGVMYRSESKYILRGGSEVTSLGDTEASINLSAPTLVELGYKIELSSRLDFGLEVEWQDWSQYGDLALNGTPLGDLAFQFRWDDGYLLQAGASYIISETRTVRAGYALNKGVQNPRFYRPSLTDMDKDWFGLGVSEILGKLRIHASFLYGTGKENISEGLPEDGVYEFTGKIFQLGLSYQI